MTTPLPAHKYCHIDSTTSQHCPAPAEWSIWGSPDPYDSTEACTAHVGALLTDAPEHRIYPIALDAPVPTAEELKALQTWGKTLVDWVEHVIRGDPQ